MKKFTKTLLQTTCAAVVGSVVAMSAHAADVTLKVHHFLPKQAPAHKQFLLKWADAVEKDSNGRIDVKVYAAMALGGKAPQLVDQVKDGFVDVVWTLPGYTPGRFPAVSAFELPFMVTDAEQTSMALQEYYESNAAVQEEFKDIHPLFFFTHDRGLMHTKGKAIRNLADLQGMKMRIPSRPVADAMAAYGATPVAMPVPAMPQALSKNVIDGTVVPYEIVPAFRLHELTDYQTEVQGDRGLYTSVFLFGMNKAKYESLDAELKAVIDKNSGIAWSQMMGKVWVDAENPGRKFVKKAGNEVINMPEADVAKMKEMAKDVHDAWVAEMNEKGLDGQALLDSANAMLDKHSK